MILSPLIHALSGVIGTRELSGCRFQPTCSQYCESALKQHGFFKGSFKSIHRISRCHPFSGDGGYDPV